MLTVAERDFPDLVPHIACLAFGFLRTAELMPRSAGANVLDWCAFDWTEQRIFVPHRVAKKAKAGEGNDRAIPINETLKHWVEPYVRPSGRIVTLR